MSDLAAIGIDVGGTKLVAAALAADGEVLQRRRLSTPAAEGDGIVEALGELVADLGADGPDDAPVGVGIAGLVDRDGVVRYGPNIGVRELPLAARLRELTGRHVTVGNDATVAAYAEARIGAAAGHDDVVMFTLGTGVGGGIVLRGDVLLGRNGAAGELGHVIVEEGGRACPCGNRGCVEAYASGTSIGLVARERLVDRDIETSLREVHDLDGADVTAAAQEGDDFARSILAEAGTWLGIAMASVVNALDPSIVVVGGGAAIRSAPFVLPAARDAMSSRLIGHAFRTAPDIVEATLSDDAGMIGAGLLALSNLERSRA